MTIYNSTGFTNPMTTLGDTIYEDGTPNPARLAGNITTTQKFLSQTGNGVGSSAPSWQIVPTSSYTFCNSICNSAGTVTLVGDSTPGASCYYGTNAGSCLGYYVLPSCGQGTVTCVTGVCANGFCPTVATCCTTPAITLNVDGTHCLPFTTDVSNWNGKGSGTVTCVSVTTANGVSGTVTTPTASACVCFTLGAITPSSVCGVCMTCATTGMLFTGGNTSKAWCVDATQCVSALAPLASPTFTGNTTVASFTNTPTSVSTQAFNGALGNIFTRVLSASETFTQSGFTTGQTFIVKVQQASGQSYTVTWWAGVTWITYGATAPIQTKTSLGYTTYGFVTTGTNTFDGYLISSQ